MYANYRYIISPSIGNLRVQMNNLYGVANNKALKLIYQKDK